MSNGVPSRTLTTVPQRRQNSSCDPCRRSKRRCTFPLVTLDISSPACAHCQRLGHQCTFNFATSRLDLKSRRKQRKQDNTTSNTFQDEANCFEVSDETTDSTHLNCENVFDEWLNIDNSSSSSNNGSSSNLNYPTDDYISGPRSPTADRDQNLLQVALAPRHLRNQNHSLPLSVGSLLGVSRRSPIHLLNSKLDETILDTRLARIFETIISGCALRYLDYDCNLYATQRRYRLESSTISTSPASPETDCMMDESYADSTLLESQILSPHGSNQPSAHLHASDQRMNVTPAREGACNMTIVGCARFLDHLAGLYGNRLNPAAQRQSNETLNATLRLFALQWMPSAQSSSDSQLPSNRHSSLEAYTDTWFRVRSRVLASQNIQSFRVVLAIFMFDGTAIPSKARDSLGTETDHEFLDVGLRTLCLLNQLVVQYCTTLGPFSQYSALAEASLSLVRWCGYMRDLGAALTANHECKLPALFARGNG
ncbi:hypothetical protein N7466_002243 [Penicillium verhagenii]|uniref:uncharacterized protein n=1 Tax=Penicillium verhagenii TaxID=1562060 RepID=UPI0025457060|nr:uncharacterized protein N7466_002243 [Penicillium verhagenii]KAJ5939109.1 hypothetical protein N7466_002243 [Penicillium verhagenii]